MAIDTSKLQINNDQLLKGLTSTSLSVIDYLVKLDAQDDADKVNAYTKTVVDGIKILQNNYDPSIAKSVKDGLDSLNTASQDSDFNEGYQTGMAELYKYGTVALNGLQEREKMLTKYENDLAELENSMPAFESRTVDSADIIGDIQNTQITIADKVYATNASRLNARIDNLTKRQESINMVQQMDQSPEKGVQIALDDFSTEYYKEALKSLGFVELKQDTSKYKEFVLPNDMKMNINNYADAAVFLDKVRQNDIAIAQAAIIEDETRPLEIVRDMMTIGDSNEMNIATALGETLFASPESNSNVAGTLKGKNLERYTNLINTLSSLKTSGKYDSRFEQMQTDYINMTNKLDKGVVDKAKLTAQELTPEATGPLEFAIKNVNESIQTLNAGLDGEDKQGTIPAFSKDSEVLATVSETKRSLIDKLQDIVEQENNASGFSAPYFDEPLFKSLKQANSVETQYILMNQLIEKYINKEGIMQDISTPIENIKRASVIEDIFKAFIEFESISPTSSLSMNEEFILNLKAAEGR